MTAPPRRPRRSAWSLPSALVLLILVGCLLLAASSSWRQREQVLRSSKRDDEFGRAERIHRLAGTEHILRHLGLLGKGLDDPSLRVRLAAVAKLSQAPSEEATELLKKALADGHRSVAARAYRSLIERGVRVPPPFPEAEFTGHSGAIPADVLAGLASPHLSERQIAIVSLKKFANPWQAAVLLDQALGDPEVKIRFLAVEELARLPSSYALAALQRASQDEDSRVRDKAREVLDRAEPSPVPANPGSP